MQVRTRSRRGSRSLAIIGVFALLLVMLPLTSAVAQERVNRDVLEGDDPTAASVAWSQYTFDSATAAALGRDDRFPDSLASSLIQGQLGAPLLLTDSDQLEQAVADELERLGVDTVHVLGGEAAISADVVQELEDAGYDVIRHAGPTRIETALDIAEVHAPDATTGLLVRAFGGPTGDETQAWADALAAGGWAADAEVPVFLTQTNELNENLADYLAGSDIDTIIVIGGTAAISDNVVNELQAMGMDTDRVSGPNRFATAVAIAEARGFSDASDASEVILSEGQATNAWAGGFTAAARSALADAPIVLSNGGDVPTETEAFLSPATGATALVCGPLVNTAACDEAADQMDLGLASEVTVTTTSVVRGDSLQGSISNPGGVQSLSVSGACVSAGAVSFNTTTGAFSIPVSSTAETGSCTLTFTITYDTGQTETVTRTVTVTQPPTVTARPELVSAQIVSLTTPAQATGTTPQGTRIRYTFDEELSTFGGTAPVAARFHAYTAENTRFNGTDFVFESGNRSLVVRYNDIETQTEFDALTVAAVERDAVFDTGGLGGTEGDAAIGTSGQTTTGQAGITSAPDLVRLENFREGFEIGRTAVDFIFDQNAFRTTGVGAGDFKLVMVDGSVIVCTAPASGSVTPGGQTNVGGEGTTRFTILCVNPGATPGTVAGTAITASNTARGVVEANAVAATAAQAAAPATPDQNPLHAEDVSPNIASPRPDLVTATFEPGTGANLDAVVYNFDQTVTGTTLANFQVYVTNGTEVAAVAPQTATINPSNNAQVRVTYPQGTLNTAVGANALEGAVTSGAGDNRDDEVAVANPTTTTRTPGRTIAADLTAVALDRGTDAFGNPTDFRATYTFDETVDDAAITDARFHLYLADGTRLQATTCDRVAAPGSPAGTAGENQVRCTAYNVAGGGAATSAQVGSAVLGTAEFDAADDLQAQPNPEGAEVASGTTGTPQQ